MAPSEHPLIALLGPAWLCLARGEVGTTVLLHRASGLWIELSDEASDPLAPWPQLTEALRGAAKTGGHHAVTAIKVDEVVTITIEPLQPRGGTCNSFCGSDISDTCGLPAGHVGGCRVVDE